MLPGRNVRYHKAFRRVPWSSSGTRFIPVRFTFDRARHVLVHGHPEKETFVKIKSFVLGGAALLSVVGLSAPALSHTHHPSTATERKQTNDLNAQALAQAQGQPMQQ